MVKNRDNPQAEKGLEEYADLPPSSEALGEVPEIDPEVLAEEIRQETHDAPPEDEGFEREFAAEAKESMGDLDEIFRELLAALKESPEAEKLGGFGRWFQRTMSEAAQSRERIDEFLKAGDHEAVCQELEKLQLKYHELADVYAPGVKSMAREVARDVKGPRGRKALKALSQAVDFVPFVGPVKMMVEAAKGGTYDGKELHGWKRFKHFAEGGVFLVLDAVGVGVVSKVGKGAKSAKALTRGAALLRVQGVSRGVYQPVYRAGRFLARNPKIGLMADRGLDAMILQRKARKAQTIDSIRQGLKAENDTLAQAA